MNPELIMSLVVLWIVWVIAVSNVRRLSGIAG